MEDNNDAYRLANLEWKLGTLEEQVFKLRCLLEDEIAERRRCKFCAYVFDEDDGKICVHCGVEMHKKRDMCGEA